MVGALVDAKADLNEQLKLSTRSSASPEAQRNARLCSSSRGG